MARICNVGMGAKTRFHVSISLSLGTRSSVARGPCNPIYLAFFLVYGGIGVWAQSPWVLILTLPLAITIRYGVVAREEAYLERRFGDAYRNYTAAVRRWV